MAESGLLETLRRSGGIDAIARHLDISPRMAAASVEALLPAVIGGYRRSYERSGGNTGPLLALLATLGGGTLAADILGPEPGDPVRGDDVLVAIFGAGEVSDAVAATIGQRSLIDPLVLRQILPQLAMLVGGYLAARAGGAGASGNQAAQARADFDAALPALLDLDRPENPLDEILIASQRPA